MPFARGFRVAENGLHSKERVLVDDRLEVARDVDSPGVVADPACVKRVFEHVAKALVPDPSPLAGTKT